jgi:SAM-dependent methyltransferase/predicted nuclease with TOPRIM domain
MSSTDYRAIYDDYWRRPDRVGESSFPEAHELAVRILRTVGPGRVLDVGCGMGKLVRRLLRLGIDAYGADVSTVAIRRNEELSPGRFVVGDVRALPFADASFDVVVTTDCLEHLHPDDIPAALRELHRVARGPLYVQLAVTQDRDQRWHLTVRDRAWWENAFLQAGFRKHPGYYHVTPFETLERSTRQIVLALEKLSPEVLARYPLEALANERDLHMDMLRECGRRADAHVARYVLAASLVRPGDCVLDAACGLGYGTHVLRQLSDGALFTGVDLSRSAIEYATANFTGADATIKFAHADVADLSTIPDHSLDVVVSFETLEHLHHPEQFLAECRRILRPGGRVIVSVPNQWVDDTGRDPNPHHFHVYDWPKVRAQVAQHFLLERAYRQIAGDGLVHARLPRTLREVPTDEPPEDPAEWWILVGTVDPLNERLPPYRETAYRYSAPPDHLLAFERDYGNPWLVRFLVAFATRSVNPRLLREVAERVLTTARGGSADEGAALCVAGYQLLEHEDASWAAVSRALDRLAVYLAREPGNPHELRWRISLAFLRGQLLMKAGQLREAEQAFAGCARLDCRSFSPTLGTKTVLAAFLAGWLCYGRGEIGAARRHWRAALAEARRLLRADWTEFLGRPQDPLPFPMGDAVELIDSAVLCANALRVTAARAAVPAPLVWSEMHKCWKQMIDERWRGLQRAEALIRERDETVEAQTRLVEERWQALQQMETMLRERDAWLADQQRCLEAAEKLASERYDAIQEQSRLIEQRDAWIDDLQGRLAAAGELASQRYEAIQSQSRRIDDLRSCLATAETLARERFDAIQSQSRRIDDLRSCLAAAEALARERFDAIQSQSRRIDDLCSCLAAAETLARERFDAIQSQSRRIDDLCSCLAAAEALARERYDAIQTQSRMIAERDAEITALRELVAEKELAMSRMETELRTRADRLTGDLHAVTERLTGLEAELARYRGVLGRLLRVSRFFGVVLRPSRWRGKR